METRALYTAQPTKEEFLTTKHQFQDMVDNTASLLSDITELERTNQDRTKWNAAWKTTATIWRKIARLHLAKIEILYIHIETQDTRIRELVERIGYIKEKLERNINEQ